MQRDVRVYLQDMQLHTSELADLIAGTSKEEFLGSRVLRLAVERVYITLCTIIRRMEGVSSEVEQRIDSVAKIVGFRNLLVHEYDKIDDEEVWKITQQSLPKLRE